MKMPQIILRGENVISLATAAILDDGSSVCLQLLPSGTESSVPGIDPAVIASSNLAWLYRHRDFGEEELGFLSFQRHLRFMHSHPIPYLTLIWSESGESVAATVNNEPWGFIDGSTSKGYSKGIIDPLFGNQWHQRLFDKLFRPAGTNF
jgi:hypothetical protein